MQQLSSLLFFLVLSSATACYAIPRINYLVYRGSTQSLEVAGEFNSITAKIYLNGVELPLLFSTDSLLVADFDSVAAPWHGHIQVQDNSGFSNTQRLSIYWLHLREFYDYSAGTARTDRTIVEFWLALPLDASRLLTQTGARVFSLDPLPISKTKSFQNNREYNEHGDIYTWGDYESSLIDSTRGSVPGWSTSLYVDLTRKRLTIEDASVRCNGWIEQQGKTKQPVQLTLSYKGHDIVFDKDLKLVGGTLTYNYDPPDHNLDHYATWQLDSIQSPILVKEVRTNLSDTKSHRMRIFPNPVSRSARISDPGGIEKCHGWICNLLGAKLMEVDLYEGKDLNLESLPPGSYILRACEGESVAISKQ